MIRLLNVLSSFPAVYEVLAGKPLPTKDEYSLVTYLNFPNISVSAHDSPVKRPVFVPCGV